jgi:hypothetical protein
VHEVQISTLEQDDELEDLADLELEQLLVHKSDSEHDLDLDDEEQALDEADDLHFLEPNNNLKIKLII